MKIVYFDKLVSSADKLCADYVRCAASNYAFAHGVASGLLMCNALKQSEFDAYVVWLNDARLASLDRNGPRGADHRAKADASRSAFVSLCALP